MAFSDFKTISDDNGSHTSFLIGKIYLKADRNIQVIVGLTIIGY